MGDAAGNVNLMAVVVAAVSAFILGGVWYAPFLFGKAWQAEAKLSDDDLKARPLGLVFGGSFVLSLIAAYVFAMFIGPSPALGFALGAGFSAGLCWVAASFGINYLFEKKSLKLFLINGGYSTAQFTLYGLVLGLMQ
jgi:hypothetical protein